MVALAYWGLLMLSNAEIIEGFRSIFDQWIVELRNECLTSPAVTSDDVHHDPDNPLCDRE
jgi:hypothetical protein